MSRLVESIKIENGKIVNAKFSNLRFNTARKELFGAENEIDLNEAVQVPVALKSGLVKCRVLYQKEIETIEFDAYKVSYIRSLKIVRDNNAAYNYKFTERGCLNELLKQKGKCDDILIVKNGLVTDTSRTNIIFYNGTKWITPSSYLLNGTQRQRLLYEGKIGEQEVKEKDICTFQKARVINAFFDLAFGVDFPITEIYM